MKKTLSISVIFITLVTLFAFTVNASHPFTDVKDNHWYKDAVEYCYNNKFVNGMTETTYGPTKTVNRAMVVMILANMAKYDADSYSGTSFPDVKTKDWFAKPVEWAYQNGVANGKGEKFEPLTAVTRQELAMFLQNYAKFTGSSVTPVNDKAVDAFSDNASIAGWARASMNWAVENAVMSGNPNGTLNPRDGATRAELAVMIMNFDKNFNDMDAPVGPTDPNGKLASDYSVSSAFSDNMILQKDEPCSVWGWAPAVENGKFVKITINGKTAFAEIKNGEWKVTFSETFSVNTEGTSIYINDTESYKNVLFGDVYYVIGQSNVHYSLLEMKIDSITKRFEDDVIFDFDDARNIRFFRNSNTYHMTNTGDRAQGTVTLYKDAEVPGGWQKPSDVKVDYDTNYPTDINNFPRAVASSEVFSALGYLFAYNMSEVTDTPIGVIEIDASGFPLIAFAPNELAEKWGSEAYNEATGQYFYYLKGVNMEGYATGDLASPTMYTRFAYNQQIYPLINFSTAGILWYQGESDWASTRETLLDSSKGTFQTQFAELMTYYREHMGNNDFPVYVIEFPSCFPSYNPNKIQHYIPTGAVRTEVGIIPQILDNSYVVACSDFFYDVNWENNIHPYIKHLQAARLANMALSVGYDIEGYDINYTSGPVLKDVNYVSDNKIEINFNYVADGLRSFDESGDEIIFGLDILVDGQWIEYLDAVISDEDTVTVEYDGGTIEGVRYNRNTEAMFYAQVTLGSYNDELHRAIPAVAFVDYKN